MRAHDERLAQDLQVGKRHKDPAYGLYIDDGAGGRRTGGQVSWACRERDDASNAVLVGHAGGTHPGARLNLRPRLENRRLGLGRQRDDDLGAPDLPARLDYRADARLATDVGLQQPVGPLIHGVVTKALGGDDRDAALLDRGQEVTADAADDDCCDLVLDRCLERALA